MIEIQEMTAADVADIAALERLCFSAPWSENSIAEELETGFSLWLVARLDGAFAGYVGGVMMVNPGALNAGRYAIIEIDKGKAIPYLKEL